ncbi:VOC family protein [Gaetbulibacter aestuarii]|uniref:VOC family protein n=1 Tax=Gaetbulibacter aestuarii TaxID=1502358 RepID=A0ABW7MX90_9FLAO
MKKSIILGVVISLFLCFETSTAQNEGTNTGKESHTNNYNLTLQHTTVVVSNFEESRKFYIDILGLKQIKVDWLPQNQMFVALGNNLELHVGEVPGVTINPSNFNHFAISSNDLDGYLEHLNNNGIFHFNLGGDDKGFIQTRPDGVRQTFIQDPDGYWIEINDKN